MSISEALVIHYTHLLDTKRNKKQQRNAQQWMSLWSRCIGDTSTPSNHINEVLQAEPISKLNTPLLTAISIKTLPIAANKRYLFV